MGIARGTARLLLEEHKRRPFSGSVLQLGRSSVYVTRGELEGWAREQGVELAPGVPDEPSHDPRLARQGCLADTTFFRLLGFDEVASCDISDWEGARVIADLNEPVAEEHHGRWDAVFETGTSVQIFDLPEVLANVHRFLKVGGRAIHAAVPSNNHVDLGFYMVSPTLFTDYYHANRYELDACYLCEYVTWWQRGRLRSAPWDVYEYTPGSLDHLSYGRYGRAQAAVFVVATKGEASTGGVAPQLGQYRESWARYAAAGDDPAVAAGERDDAGTSSGLVTLSPLKRLTEWVRRRWRTGMPPRVGRF